MTYKEYANWRLRDQRELVYDIENRRKKADEQLDKAIADGNKELIKYWGYKTYKYDDELELASWQLRCLVRDLSGEDEGKNEK